VSEHLSVQLFERYRQRRLEPAELLALDDHLATCAACREQLRAMKPSRAALLRLRANLQTAAQTAPDHLLREQLVAYIRSQLDEVDRELVESHLEFCPQCAAQAQELRALTERQAAAVTASPATADSQITVSTWWAKLVASLGLPSLRERFLPAPGWSPLALRVASAVATVLLVLATALWLRTRIERQEIAGHQPTPSPSPAQPSVSPPVGPQPATPAPILLALNDGSGQITLDAQGKIAGLESLSPADQQRVKTALTTQTVQTPKALKELSDSSGAIMGSSTGAAFALLSPIGKLVASDRPTFRWQPLGRSVNYQVTITDPEASYREVAASPALSGTKWVVDHPLERGRIYTWQVTARTEGGEIKAPAPNAPEARFKVLEQAKAGELARAKKTYAGRHLVLGLLYAQAGLLDEAEREFQALVAANSGSPVAKNLLRDVRAKQRAR
jgi:hypothetical protein